MADNGPLVSVLIPTFNAGRFISATIESALRQTVQDVEVLVLDDGSTDDTVERVRAFPDRRLRLTEYRHRGAPAVLNDGLALARGRYIALLDHDDLWLPAKLSRHIAFFDRHPDAAVTFSWSDLIDEHDRPIAVHPVRWRGPIAFRELLTDYVIGPSSSIVMQRSAVERAGGFDTRLPRCHDMDLTLRIAFGGAGSVVAVPETLTLYRRHAGQMSRDWHAMHLEWNIVLEKCRALSPVDVGIVERYARSNMHRYLAYLAYEDGDFADARGHVRSALRINPRGFMSDVRNWKIAAACGAEWLLPPAVHRRLERIAGLHREAPRGRAQPMLTIE